MKELARHLPLIIAATIIVIGGFLVAKPHNTITGKVITFPSTNNYEAVVGEVVSDSLAGSSHSITQCDSCFDSCTTAGAQMRLVAKTVSPTCTAKIRSGLQTATIIVNITRNHCTPTASCSPSTNNSMDWPDFVYKDPPEDPNDPGVIS